LSFTLFNFHWLTLVVVKPGGFPGGFINPKFDSQTFIEIHFNYATLWHTSQIPLVQKNGGDEKC